MSFTASLSIGALSDILNNEKANNKYILQVIATKKVSAFRLRILLSDGKYMWNFVIFNFEQMETVLTENDVILLEDFLVHTHGDRRILVIKEFSVLAKGDRVGKIGTPELLSIDGKLTYPDDNELIPDN